MTYRIKQIKPKGKAGARFSVELEPEPEEPLELCVDVLGTSAIARGDEIDDDRLAELRAEDELHRCRMKAWDLLGRRPRSRRELERALKQRKFSAVAISQSVERLDDLGHIDDATYARLHVDQRVARGKSGPRLVRQELAQKGVAAELIDEALSPAEDPDHQRNAALALAQKWNRRSKPEDHQKRKAAAAAYLLRRGFDGEIVWSVIAEVIKADEEDAVGGLGDAP